MEETILSAMWRRLDIPGHDSCRLRRMDAGWLLEGAAVFRHQGSTAALHYSVACDRAWRSRHGVVRGWIGPQDFHFRIDRTATGLWTLNGVAAAGLEACADLDFGFTPATNILQLRRLGLAVGRSAEAPAAWLDVPEGVLQLLPQRYERRSELTYWYEAPTAGYSGLLEIGPEGFVRRYPGLWEREN